MTEHRHIEAPWTDEQIEQLNRFQQCEFVHPFTGTRGPNGEERALIATPDGWVESLGGPVVQTWAHSFMADGSWEEIFTPFTRLELKGFTLLKP